MSHSLLSVFVLVPLWDKRAVDASVFLINLTSALIKFVMTAELVPVSHQTLD